MFSRRELKPWGEKNRADLGFLATSKVERGEFNRYTKGTGYSQGKYEGDGGIATTHSQSHWSRRRSEGSNKKWS